MTGSKSFAYLSPFELKAADQRAHQARLPVRVDQPATATGTTEETASSCPANWATSCRPSSGTTTAPSRRPSTAARPAGSRLVDRKELDDAARHPARDTGSPGRRPGREAVQPARLAREAVGRRLAWASATPKRVPRPARTGRRGHLRRAWPPARADREEATAASARWNRKTLQEALEDEPAGHRPPRVAWASTASISSTRPSSSSRRSSTRCAPNADRPNPPAGSTPCAASASTSSPTSRRSCRSSSTTRSSSRSRARSTARRCASSRTRSSSRRRRASRGQWLFQYLFDFCQSQSMIEPWQGPQRRALTVKGQAPGTARRSRRSSNAAAAISPVGHWCQRRRALPRQADCSSLYLDRHARA